MIMIVLIIMCYFRAIKWSRNYFFIELPTQRTQKNNNSEKSNTPDEDLSNS